MITLNNLLHYVVGAFTRPMPVLKANSTLLGINFTFVLPLFAIVFACGFGFSFGFSLPLPLFPRPLPLPRPQPKALEPTLP